MNKHKSNWSAMGLEPSPSVKEEDFKKFEHQLRILIGKYGARDVLTAVRTLYEKEAPNGNCRNL
jgi:hypothetical protein